MAKLTIDRLTDPAAVPEHIPAEAIYDFDFRYDPDLLTDPHRRIVDLIDVVPSVFWTPRNGGTWIAVGFDEVFRAFRETDTFSSSLMPRELVDAALAKLPEGTPRIPEMTPITIDPPDHAKLRHPLQTTFSPKAAIGRVEEIRSLCDALIDAVLEDGHCEFISAIAEPLPVTVFLRLMGLPVTRLQEFRSLVHEVLNQEHDLVSNALTKRKVADVLRDQLLERRDRPADDLISHLWAAEIDSEPMTLELMEDYAVILFIAGLDTVINGMGFAVRHLALNPDLQDQLRAEPDLIPDAVEEMLRRYSFVMPMRRLTRDTELGGFLLKEGDRVALFTAGADLDERKFEHPDQFELKRGNRSHVAFGGGPHRCLGMHLARVELQVLYGRMLARLPTWRLDADKPPQFHSGHIIALDRLHIRWD